MSSASVKALKSRIAVATLAAKAITKDPRAAVALEIVGMLVHVIAELDERIETLERKLNDGDA